MIFTVPTGNLAVASVAQFAEKVEPIEDGNSQASIQGLIFDDANGDGRLDRGTDPEDGHEAGMAGVIVELLDADGTVLATTVTDIEGRYVFGANGVQANNGALSVGQPYSVRISPSDPAVGSVVQTTLDLGMRGQQASGEWMTASGQATLPTTPVDTNIGLQTTTATSNALGEDLLEFDALPQVTQPAAPFTNGTPINVYEVKNIPSTTGTPAERGLWIKCLDVDVCEDCASEYEMIGATLTEFSDGTARLVGVASHPDLGSFNVDFQYSGRTTVPTHPDSPKLPNFSVDTSDWVYYQSFTGTLTGVEGDWYEGAEVEIEGYGASFQIGDGANIFTTAFGASGWFRWDVISNSNHPYLRYEGECGNDNKGDINVELHRDDTECEEGFVKDSFSHVSYNNNDGDMDWKGPWHEVDVWHPEGGNGPSHEPIYIDGGRLKLTDRGETGGIPYIERCVDLSGVDEAELKFKWHRVEELEPEDRIQVWVWSAATQTWQFIFELYGDNDDDDSGTVTADITQSISDHTCVRFEVDRYTHGSHEYFGIDWVKITKDCNEPAAVCGNGVLEAGEACDDGNNNNDDGCRNDCTIPVCGDGILDAGEACDDGNNNNDDSCRNDCTIPVCGDGHLDPGEDCDDGNNHPGDGCRPDCTVEICGDGVVDPGEQCDDGNDNNLDGCRNDCTLPVCGDGVVDPGEECDDGDGTAYPLVNIDSSQLAAGRTFWVKCIDSRMDANSATHYTSVDNQFVDFGDGTARLTGRIENPDKNGAWDVDLFLTGRTTTPPAGSPKLPGFAVDPSDWVYFETIDGTLTGVAGTDYEGSVVTVTRRGEAFQLGDGANLKTENFGASTWFSWDLVQADVNGALRATDHCDPYGDINADFGDPEPCQPNCKTPACGDGIVDPGEECDDGNDVNDDDCRNDCTIPVCGDGIVDPGEQCDDGNDVNDDACRNDCTIPVCGDGIVDPGEQCDDGNDVNDDACRNDCTIPVCGDGIVDPGEQCDDGNDVNDDACRNDCTIPVCGDGIVDPGEQCDDGNDVNDDACRNDCTIPVCGDGIVDPGEQCDDGNDVNDDACRNDCTIPVCGDGIVDAGEQCDDGNDVNDDACRNDCTIPVCGDGIVDPGEQCDDGNTNNMELPHDCNSGLR